MVLRFIQLFDIRKMSRNICNGWKTVAIIDAISKDSRGLKTLGTFQAVNSLDDGGEISETTTKEAADDSPGFFVTPKSNEDKSENYWETSEGGKASIRPSIF